MTNPTAIQSFTQALKQATPARPTSPVKKITYAAIGGIFILTAVVLQRIDGGGLDLILLIVLGLWLLIASADPVARRVRDGP